MDGNENRYYRALFELARSISRHSRLQSLCENLGKLLHQIAEFRCLGLAFYEADQDLLRWNAATISNIPAKLVLQEQRPMVIQDLAAEMPRPKFITYLNAVQDEVATYRSRLSLTPN